MAKASGSVRSQCPYCGVGCGLELLPPAQPGRAVSRDAEGTPMWTARGDRQHPSSLGQVCIKGATVGAAAGPVGGKSGSKAAKKGAGVGVISAASRNSRNRRQASANASAQTDQIVKNCMRGRGYAVLN